MSLPFSLGRLRGAVKWLLISNLIFFLIQQFGSGWFETNCGLVPYRFWAGLQVWRIFTYLFLHGGFFHFLMNMFTLWMFGRELENVWGTGEFLKFYFICGICAGIFNIIFEPFSTVSIIGASGAIYGLLAAFAIVFPDSVIYLYGIIPMQAKQFVILLGVIEFFASFHGAPTFIARLAHLGGLLTGYFYLKSYEFRSLSDRIFHKLIDSIIVTKESVRNKKQSKKMDIAKEVDRILEKVLTHGADSLTEEEREIMRRYSSGQH